MSLTRRSALLIGGAAIASPAFARPPLTLGPLVFVDRPRASLQQGGYALLRADPRAAVRLDGEAVGACSANGWSVVGFDRDAGPAARLDVAGEAERTLAIAPRQWRTQAVNGLPQDTVAPSDPALLARIRREAEQKARAFASRADIDDFAGRWIAPVEGTMSSSFGNQRILNGVPSRPHYGVDIAAPRGAQVSAPAGGIVVLAEPNMHFEGGLVLVDHGQGLVSCYLHLSRIDVREGQRVARGARLGAVGATGRATGPHLCWRLKWRNRNMDPSLWLA